MKGNKFTLGFIIGGIICGGIGAIATEYIVNPNPYPIYVDGQPAEIEGYNINDKTYFQLRDIGEEIGFDVDFINDTIIVSPSTPTPTSTPIPTNNAGQPEYTDDGLEIVYLDDIAYIAISSMEKKYTINDYFFYLGPAGLYDKDKNILIDKIPTAPGQSALIPVDFYESILLPVILEYCK